MKRTDLGLALGVVICLAGSLPGLAGRHRVEASNRAAALIVEASTVASLANDASLAEALDQLKDAGATGVSIGSLSLSEAVAQGRATVRETEIGAEVAGGDEYLAAVLEFAQIRGWRVSESPGTVEVKGVEPSVLPSLVIGLDPGQVAAAKQAGLEIVARIANSPGLDAESVRALVRDAARQGATSFLPSGDSVLGFRGATDALGEELKATGTLYLTPEFAKIAGDAKVAAEAIPSVVRLHAIQQAEMDRMSDGAAMDRYVKAVKERNIRALLVRFPSLAGDQPLDDAAGFVRKLRTRLIEEGSGVRSARPLSDFSVPTVAHAVTGLGAGIVAWWLVTSLFPSLAWAALGFVPLMAGLAGSGLRPLAAFGAALALPCAAQVWVQVREGGIASRLAGGLGLPTVGGLCVASLLADLPHMLSLEVFPGVKAAHNLPILFAVILAIRAQGGFGKLFRRPVVWGDAVLVLVGLGALGLMVVRSGNDSPAAVSGWELQFRDVLDKVLYTRPRTKEFLIGNPALVIGCLLSARRFGDAWASVLLVLGAIGQTSITNSFCHLHSPLLLTTARVGIGIVLGGILGLVVWGLAGKRLWPARGKTG